jgi:hypothetical protein
MNNIKKLISSMNTSHDDLELILQKANFLLVEIEKYNINNITKKVNKKVLKINDFEAFLDYTSNVYMKLENTIRQVEDCNIDSIDNIDYDDYDYDDDDYADDDDDDYADADDDDDDYADDDDDDKELDAEVDDYFNHTSENN